MLSGRGGEDYRALPLATPAGAARATIPDSVEHIRLAGGLPGGGAELLRAAYQLGLEGIVSKRLEAPYEAREGRRAESWIKAKCRPAQEVVR